MLVSAIQDDLSDTRYRKHLANVTNTNIDSVKMIWYCFLNTVYEYMYWYKQCVVVKIVKFSITILFYIRIQLYFFWHFISDVNECLGENKCSQVCSNTPGSYHCSCNPGFRLDRVDHSTCKRKLPQNNSVLLLLCKGIWKQILKKARLWTATRVHAFKSTFLVDSTKWWTIKHVVQHREKIVEHVCCYFITSLKS